MSYQGTLNFEWPQQKEPDKLSLIPAKQFYAHYLENFQCPLCKKFIERSEYLHSVFYSEPLVEYLANLITHYRHNHITAWNKCWSHGGGRYRSKWFGDYDQEKAKVNERAKRQLIRQAFPIFIDLGIHPYHFEKLKNTTPETMKVANKFLP